jgi:hypothetical protein
MYASFLLLTQTYERKFYHLLAHLLCYGLPEGLGWIYFWQAINGLILAGHNYFDHSAWAWHTIRELAQKPQEPHTAFWRCAKPRAETKVEVLQKLSGWKGWWAQVHAMRTQKKISAPQFLRTGHGKCGNFPWSL